MNLTADQAKIVLASDATNVTEHEKRLLQKVVDKKPLSDAERGKLEGVMAKANSDQLRIRTAASAGKAEARKTKSTIAIGTKDFAIAARRRLVLELRMRHPAPSISAIAEELKVNRDTIWRDICALRKEHAEVLDGRANMELLGQTLAQYDILHGKSMALAEQFSGPNAKATLLRTAGAALDSKTRLMADTGVIRRAPVKTEHSATGPMLTAFIQLLGAVDGAAKEKL